MTGIPWLVSGARYRFILETAAGTACGAQLPDCIDSTVKLGMSRFRLRPGSLPGAGGASTALRLSC